MTHHLSLEMCFSKPSWHARTENTANMPCYYMGSSVSGQDDLIRAVIGYPSGQDGAILPARDYPLYPTSKVTPKGI